MSERDDLDRLEQELDLPRVLVVNEDPEGDVSIDCPGEDLSDNDRIAILVKALMCELGPVLVAVIDGVAPDDDDEE